MLQKLLALPLVKLVYQYLYWVIFQQSGTVPAFLIRQCLVHGKPSSKLIIANVGTIDEAIVQTYNWEYGSADLFALIDARANIRIILTNDGDIRYVSDTFHNPITASMYQKIPQELPLGETVSYIREV